MYLFVLILLLLFIVSYKECIGCDQPPVFISDYYRVMNSEVPSCTINVIPNISESSCENMCTNNPNCKFYNYNITSNNCHLKAPLINFGTILGLKRQDNEFNLYQDRTIPNHIMNDMPIENITLDNCSSKCSSNKNCHWFTYDRNKRFCNLHKAYLSNHFIQAHKP